MELKTSGSFQACVAGIGMVLFQYSKRASPALLWRSVDALMGHGRHPTTDTIGPNELHAFFMRKLPSSKLPQLTRVRGTSGLAVAIMDFPLWLALHNGRNAVFKIV